MSIGVLSLLRGILNSPSPAIIRKEIVAMDSKTSCEGSSRFAHVGPIENPSGSLAIMMQNIEAS